jgi:hypothetical protein
MSKELKMPRAWLKAAAKPEKTKVAARIDMSPEVAGKGLCPECRNPMTIAHAGISRSWVCVADRIALPLPNGYQD